MTNNFWSFLIVEELIRNGINYFVISPGSRSTPLTVAVARNSQAQKNICYDERGAAFHALGYSRATLNPAVLICTSGTAAANYFPAVIEASVERVPMIILSADRPPELRQTGANQTIEQFNIYGNYAKWQFDFPCPDPQISPRMVLTTIDQAAYQARQSPSGVVHLNCMFRKPLAPTDADFEEADFSFDEKWSKGEQSYTYYTPSVTMPQEKELETLVTVMQSTTRGILVVGQLKSISQIQGVIKLASCLNWAVFADVQSGIRFSQDIPNLIHYFDQLLLTDDWQKGQAIETVLQIGDRIVSKRWLEYVAKHPPQNYVAIMDNSSRHDPVHILNWRLEGDICQVCTQIVEKWEGKGINKQQEPWVEKLTQQSQQINQLLDELLLSTTKISEPAIARLISGNLPNHHGLFLASSMPIREMDMYGVDTREIVSVAANRGASGIDGTIACTSGFACGLKAPVTLLIGDLAFFHDLNSLHLLKSLNQPLVIVVVNNNGGGIFSFLPIAQCQDVFETYFGTPHQLEFDHAAQMFGIDYYHPQSLEEFLKCYQEAINNQYSTIIEVTTNREENLLLHQTLQQKIISVLKIK